MIRRLAVKPMCMALLIVTLESQDSNLQGHVQRDTNHLVNLFNHLVNLFNHLVNRFNHLVNLFNYLVNSFNYLAIPMSQSATRLRLKNSILVLPNPIC